MFDLNESERTDKLKRNDSVGKVNKVMGFFSTRINYEHSPIVNKISHKPVNVHVCEISLQNVGPVLFINNKNEVNTPVMRYCIYKVLNAIVFLIKIQVECT